MHLLEVFRRSVTATGTLWADVLRRMSADTNINITYATFAKWEKGERKVPIAAQRYMLALTLEETLRENCIDARELSEGNFNALVSAICYPSVYVDVFHHNEATKHTTLVESLRWMADATGGRIDYSVFWRWKKEERQVPAIAQQYMLAATLRDTLAEFGLYMADVSSALINAVCPPVRKSHIHTAESVES